MTSFSERIYCIFVLFFAARPSNVTLSALPTSLNIPVQLRSLSPLDPEPCIERKRKNNPPVLRNAVNKNSKRETPPHFSHLILPDESSLLNLVVL